MALATFVGNEASWKIQWRKQEDTNWRQQLSSQGLEAGNPRKLIVKLLIDTCKKLFTDHKKLIGFIVCNHFAYTVLVDNS